MALILITIVITLGPVLGAAILYAYNPLELVIPPNIAEMLSGSFFTNRSPEPPKFEGSQYDVVSRTVTLRFNFANPINRDITINSMNATVECTADNFSLGTTTLKNPVNVHAGETALITIEGAWTEAAINHFQTDHLGEQEIDVNLVGLVIDMDGMMIQMNEPVRVPHVPLP